MIQISTLDDVLRYVYEETTDFENEQVQDTLVGDPELLVFYLGALETKHLMNKIIRVPSDKTLQNILSFSRNYAVA